MNENCGKRISMVIEGCVKLVYHLQNLTNFEAELS